MRWVIYGSIQERHLTTSLADALRAEDHEVEVVDGVARDYVVEPDDDVSMEAARRIDAALPADVLFCIRVDEPRDPFIRSLRDRGITTIAWFVDDPLNYAAIYERVVEAYDLTLHTGAEDVLEFYEERHGARGYHFPFFTDDAHHPYVYDPQRADLDLGFLGNAAGPREIDRYALLASLPFSVGMFGRLPRRAEDWAGILAGYLAEDQIPAGMARFKVGFNIAQPFDDSIVDKYGWPGVERFHEFFFPSRLVALAACGIPTVSLQHPAMPQPLDSTVVVNNRTQLIEAVRVLLDDLQDRIALSRAARAEFEAHLTSASRVRMLEQLLAGPREHDLATRATLWRRLGPPLGQAPLPPIPMPVRIDPSPLEQLARTRVLVLGRRMDPGSASGGLVADADAAGVEAVAIDVEAISGIAADPFHAPQGEAPIVIDDDVLIRAAERADPDAAVFLDGVVPSAKASGELRARGVVPLGLWLHGVPHARDRFDRVMAVPEDVAAGIDPEAPIQSPEGGNVRVLGGHPEVAAGVRWRLGERLTDDPAAVEVFLDTSDPAEVLASSARGSLPLIVGELDHAVETTSPRGALGAALYYLGRHGEARSLAEELREGAAASARWALRWPSILRGVAPRAGRRTRPRITAIGHWGRGNLGDDLLLDALLEQLPCDPTIVTYDPEGAMRTHGTPAIHINDVGAVEAALRRSAALVIGGGGLLHDLSFRGGGTERDVFGGSGRMLPRMARIAAEARALGVPVALHSIGVGPLETEGGRRIVRFLCDQADLISVRDAASAEQLRAVGFEGEVRVAADPVVLLPPPPPVGEGHVAVSVRPWVEAPSDLFARIAAALDQIVERSGAHIVFVPFERRDEADVRASAAVASLMHSPSTIAERDIAGVIVGARAVVAMRLHASILATSAGVASVGLTYDPKVRAFYDEAGITQRALDLDAPAQRISDAVADAVPVPVDRVQAMRARATAAVRAIEDRIVEQRPRRCIEPAEMVRVLEELRHGLESSAESPLG